MSFPEGHHFVMTHPTLKRAVEVKWTRLPEYITTEGWVVENALLGVCHETMEVLTIPSVSNTALGNARRKAEEDGRPFKWRMDDGGDLFTLQWRGYTCAAKRVHNQETNFVAFEYEITNSSGEMMSQVRMNRFGFKLHAQEALVEIENKRIISSVIGASFGDELASFTIRKAEDEVAMLQVDIDHLQKALAHAQLKLAQLKTNAEEPRKDHE